MLADDGIWRIEDANGRQLPVSIATTSSGDGRSSRDSQTFHVVLKVWAPVPIHLRTGVTPPSTQMLPPARLISLLPAEVEDLSVLVEFHDLPLP